ncbi:MAG: LysR family transcriptional regulator [Reyranella sp.]|uniref:LysR family transcriptional regulator n=1 Tax=Reyranella sp. TaxID=1929291 RepID=UPI00122818C8|nr:LysR family transcriptional regulator [Reyranella sp.]TAJ86945.1 MAG: LysR family transcriptional regulator [Reyranella sp.]
MDLHQLRCFVAVADELHFGRAARRLEMMPSALSRDIRLLETSLGTSLLLRTTRNVMLSQDGAAFVDDARALLARADALAAEVRERGRRQSRSLIRVGAIDTAAAGLIPPLLHDFREQRAAVAVQLVEDKTVRLVPKLLSGRLDVAFIRPPARLDRRIETMMLFHETPVVAIPSRHRLAGRRRLSIEALADEPMIVPDRSSRPHSHDLTIKLFQRAGLRPRVSQIAEEKQTIVQLVAAGLGLAIVPRWASRLGMAGVRFVPLASREANALDLLPMAAAWLRNARDPLRDEMLDMLRLRLPRYGAGA